VTQAFDDDLVGGRYRLVRQVGRGGMGTVWQARDELLDRTVAIKQLASSFGAAEERAEQVERIKREARMAARLDHTGVVRVYDIIDWAGSPAIVMEYVKGRSLAVRLRESGALTVQETVGLGTALLDALRHAHTAGVVHRDLKPDNVLLDDARVVITDFGIARALDGATALTRPGAIIGTPAFMAPEQIEGQEVTAAADLWSLGVTLYTAVEGDRPFKGETMAQLCVAVLTHPMPVPRYAGVLTPLLEALLVKDPEARASAEWAARYLAEAAVSGALASQASTVFEAPATGATAPAPTAVPTRTPGGMPDGAPPETIGGQQPRAPVPDRPQAGIPVQPGFPALATAVPAHDPGGLPSGPNAATTQTGELSALANEPTATAQPAVATQPPPPAHPAELALPAPPETDPHGQRPQPSRRVRRRTVVITLTCTVIAGAVAVSVILALPNAPRTHTGALAITHSGSASPKVSASPTVTVSAAFTDPNGSSTSMALAPNGSTLAVGTSNGKTYLWNTTTRKISATLTDPNSYGVSSIAFTPDGSTLAVGDLNGYTYLWNTSTGKNTGTLVENESSEIVTALAFAPNGTTLAGGVGTSGEGEGNVYVWDTTTGTNTNTSDGPYRGVGAIAFAPNGTTLAIGDNAGDVDLWNTVTGDTTTAFTLPRNSSASALKFAPSGTTLAVGASNGKTYLWNTTTRKSTATFTNPDSGGVNSVAFTPNGGTLAVGDANGNAYLWNTSTGKNTATFADHGVTTGVEDVAFEPDGTTLIIGNANGSVYLWRIPK
jgi:predicted Ser/Thr protein kinase